MCLCHRRCYGGRRTGARLRNWPGRWRLHMQAASTQSQSLSRGSGEWLHALSKSNVPCAIVTAFDRYSQATVTPAVSWSLRAFALA